MERWDINSAGDPYKDLFRESAALAESAQKRLHDVPEDSFKEIKTTAIIREYCLREAVRFIDLKRETGAAVCLEAGKGKTETVLLRADIDAVPTPDGPKHLCGHDHHTASLIGAMHCLARLKEELPVNVVFIFQPAEECTHGAKTLFQNGLLEALPQKPCACFGIHNRPELPVGKVAVHRGPLMAAKTDFKVVFTGRTGHAASPHHTIDPILAGAAYVAGIQSIIPRNLDPLEPAVCGIYSFLSGDDSNDPPRKAELTGTFRSYNKTVHSTIRSRVEELALSTARAYLCEAEVTWMPDVPPLINSSELYETACQAVESVCGKGGITDTKPTLASDDFAEFAERMPAFYYWVGSGSAPWHDPAFRVSDGYQAVAVPLLVRSVLLFR